MISHAMRYSTHGTNIVKKPEKVQSNVQYTFSIAEKQTGLDAAKCKRVCMWVVVSWPKVIMSG